MPNAVGKAPRVGSRKAGGRGRAATVVTRRRKVDPGTSSSEGLGYTSPLHGALELLVAAAGAAQQVSQLLRKACRELAQVLARAGCPAAALLALHDGHGAAMRQQFAAVVRGRLLSLGRRSDSEEATASARAEEDLQAVQEQLQHAWRRMVQLSPASIEVRHTCLSALQPRCCFIRTMIGTHNTHTILSLHITNRGKLSTRPTESLHCAGRGC